MKSTNRLLCCVLMLPSAVLLVTVAALGAARGQDSRGGGGPTRTADKAVAPIAAAQAYGKTRPAVTTQPDGLLICEGEEFQDVSPGWQAKPWGENYYAATLANTFLSRKAFLGAPEQCERAAAAIRVQVPKAGRYLALVRYEAAYRFQTQFRLVIEQQGRTALDRRYGARDNVKIWAFGQKLQKEVAWDWGANENIVWEGHDAWVDLQPGLATLTLIAERQPEPAARRNVDLVMLTTDAEEVQRRIGKEGYLPLDGLLTQAGDVFLRIANQGSSALQIKGQNFPAGTCQQHSPYWVHLRNWKPLEPITLEAGRGTEWIDVGGLLDTLNDGQWGLTVTPASSVRFEFGVKAANGQIEKINEIAGQFGELPLAFHADTRYSRLLRHREQVLFDLLEELKRQPAYGRTPTRTLVYGYTFEPGLSPRYDAGVREFQSLFALSDTSGKATSSGPPRDYIDVRGQSVEKLDECCRKLGDRAKQIAIVSLGDEISLPQPQGAQANDDFRRWLRKQGVQPNGVDPAAGGDWSKLAYSPDPKLKESQPGLYYWSRRYLQHYGIQAVKRQTDVLRRHLPHAQIGANYSPHYPTDHAYLGETYKWVTCFRDDGMTLPWSEDYIWQPPVGSPQMNNLNLDLFRAGLRGKPDAKILYYVMPHWPGNTPRMWRRLFYGALGHGMKIVDLFEFRPVQVSYTENHVTHTPMYTTVLRSFRELGLFEDIVQDGHVRPAEAGLWFSETSDIWGDSHGSFSPAKRAVYTAIRHQQVPLDILVEHDALDGTLGRYRVLYLTDQHVRTAAARKIVEWVRGGGVLLATAGAGMFDEYHRPNTVLRELLGVEPTALEEPAGAQVKFLKQDLPFAKPLDTVIWKHGEQQSRLPVIGVRSRVRLNGATTEATFSDGSPALASRTVGQGRTLYCGFLPGLSYYQPAIPKRPVDRSSAEDAMCHFLPTEFDPGAAALIGLPAGGLLRPVECSQPLVESTVLESPHGLAIPLVNWTAQPIQNLRVKLNLPVSGKRIRLASGGTVRAAEEQGVAVCTVNLDAADTLICR